MFKSAREIYTTTDNGVVHPVLTSEVSNGAEPCVDARSKTRRFFYARGSPDAIQLAHSFAHSDRHLYARDSVRLDALGIWIAEENENGVTHVLVDRSAKLESDLRHFSQIVIEELCQVL